MTTAAEAAAGGSGSNPQLAAVLAAGTDTLAGDQVVTFNLYARVVLPISGYVFWVRTTILAPGSAAFNAMGFNTTPFDGLGALPPAVTVKPVKGSIHISTMAQQDEASSAAQNQIVFTSEQYIEPLNQANPNLIYIGTFPPASAGGSPRQFAFRESVSHYRQSELWHYRGSAIFSTMATQVVDTAAQLAGLEPIVSNSLPIWLANPPIPAAGGYIPVYPSFAVPPNTSPPYVAVHIEPSSTTALQAAPLILQPVAKRVAIPPLAPGAAQFNGMGFNTTAFDAPGTGFVPLPVQRVAGNSWQLARERVRFTAYGMPNNAVIDYQNQILALAMNDEPSCPSPFGVMDMPIWRDDKQTQPELQTLAQKKTFEMEVSYYQSRVTEIALQTIRSAVVQVTVEPQGQTFWALGEAA